MLLQNRFSKAVIGNICLKKMTKECKTKGKTSQEVLNSFQDLSVCTGLETKNLTLVSAETLTALSDSRRFK